MKHGDELQHSHTPDTRFWDRIIPWYFVMAFLVVFAVNGLFVYLATSTNRGVVTENAYEKGLDFHRIVEATRKRKAQQDDY